ncbi:MAG: hypothetical protein KatS3mg045_0771 [Bellilinea sp.]|nr:MAG: hypothetical protein KatS3mg045_0771 [Bellilinea sp.]
MLLCGAESPEACQAHALGGQITVNCQNSLPGNLVVMENYFSGWSVQCDGQKLALDTQSPWLSIWLPAGKHECQFNYRPWDVYVGMLLNLSGFGLLVYLWRKPEGETGQERVDD